MMSMEYLGLVTTDVNDCLARLSLSLFIKMPTQQESVHVLHVITGFSNVISAVDGTHIRIKSQLKMHTSL